MPGSGASASTSEAEKPLADLDSRRPRGVVLCAEGEGLAPADSGALRFPGAAPHRRAGRLPQRLQRRGDRPLRSGPAGQAVSAPPPAKAGRWVAPAILVTPDGRYLMQHRDDFPHIMLPGHWSCSAAPSIPATPTPRPAIRRELREELEFTAREVHAFSEMTVVLPLDPPRIDRMSFLRGADHGGRRLRRWCCGKARARRSSRRKP